MDKKQKLISKLKELRDCWIEIEDDYMEILEKDEDFDRVFAIKYPFEGSFDEYIESIYEWIMSIEQHSNKGRIILTERDGYAYVSPKGIRYSLYEGESIKGETFPDICFIMNDNCLDSQHYKYMFVDWFWGIHYSNILDNKAVLDIIYKKVAEYEKNNKDIIEKISI